MSFACSRIGAWRAWTFANLSRAGAIWREWGEVLYIFLLGFSGFYQLVFDWQALAHIRLGGIPNYREKREAGRKRNPENPANPENPDSDKDARERRLRARPALLKISRRPAT